MTWAHLRADAEAKTSALEVPSDVPQWHDSSKGFYTSICKEVSVAYSEWTPTAVGDFRIKFPGNVGTPWEALSRAEAGTMLLALLDYFERTEPDGNLEKPDACGEPGCEHHDPEPGTCNTPERVA